MDSYPAADPDVHFTSSWGKAFDPHDITAAYEPLLAVATSDGSLDPAVKDMAAVLVGWLNNCRYTVADRCASARRLGVGAEVMRRVVRHEWDDFDKPLRMALEFTEQLTLLPPVAPYALQPQMVDADLLNDLRRHYSNAELTELALTFRRGMP